jgi:hypothetical protein
MTDRLSWDNLLAWRVQRQHLQRRSPRAGALDVATGLGGLHAQLLSSAELTLWARVDRPQEGAARALWEERALVKTWAMRGTPHLLPSAEYATWQAAPDTRRDYLRPVWLRYYGLTPATLEAVLLVDGGMAGVWRHERQGARLAVTVEPFAPLSGAVQRKVAAEARRLAGTLGGALDLTLA